MTDTEEMLKDRLDRLHNDLQIDQQNTKAEHEQAMAEIRQQLATVQAQLDQAALAANPDPNPALDERLAQYEPLVNAMLRDIRVARDRHKVLEDELDRAHREKDVAIHRMIGLGEANDPNEPAIVATRQAAVEPTKGLVKQMADMFDENQRLKTDLAAMVAADSAMQSRLDQAEAELQHALDTRRAIEAKVAPAERLVAMIKDHMAMGLISSSLLMQQELAVQIAAFENAG